MDIRQHPSPDTSVLIPGIHVQGTIMPEIEVHKGSNLPPQYRVQRITSVINALHLTLQYFQRDQ